MDKTAKLEEWIGMERTSTVAYVPPPPSLPFPAKKEEYSHLPLFPIFYSLFLITYSFFLAPSKGEGSAKGARRPKLREALRREVALAFALALVGVMGGGGWELRAGAHYIMCRCNGRSCRRKGTTALAKGR